jgi:hypothetical protein
MKNWIFTMVLCSMFSLSFAQFTFTKTKLEDAISTKDFLYKQEVFTVENIPNFRMDAVKITNLENFNSTSGLRVVHRKQVGKEQKTFYNFIDAQEIDGLAMALQYMKTILKSKTIPSNYTEIKFTTLSGFQLMLSTILDVQNKLDWSFVVQTNIENEKTVVQLSVDDIDKIQKTLDQAKSKI